MDLLEWMLFILVRLSFQSCHYCFSWGWSSRSQIFPMVRCSAWNLHRRTSLYCPVAGVAPDLRYPRQAKSDQVWDWYQRFANGQYRSSCPVPTRPQSNCIFGEKYWKWWVFAVVSGLIKEISDFAEKVLPSLTHETLKSVIAQYNATSLLTQRNEVSEIKSTLSAVDCTVEELHKPIWLLPR